MVILLCGGDKSSQADDIAKARRTGKTIGSKGIMPTLDYEEHLLEDLTDPDYAAGYLTAALEEGEDVFLLAVRDVADAHGGVGRLAEGTSLNRENLYSMLSERGNPRLSSLMSVLRELGVEIQFRARPRDTKAA